MRKWRHRGIKYLYRRESGKIHIQLRSVVASDEGDWGLGWKLKMKL